MDVPSLVSDAGALPETVGARSSWIVPRGDSDALAAVLRRAHAEHLQVDLASRGVQARQLALQRFDRAHMSAVVADTIERTARQVAAELRAGAESVQHFHQERWVFARLGTILPRRPDERGVRHRRRSPEQLPARFIESNSHSGATIHHSY
jgi:hypothetical protein